MKLSLMKLLSSASYQSLLIGAVLAVESQAVNAASAAEEAEEIMTLDELVVTGTTRPGATILESSVAVTAVTQMELQRQAPFGVADALKAVPGFFAQESGGQTSNNVGVRGLPSVGHFQFISVQEDGLPVTYDQYLADAFQRYDIGISRFEATRGGSSGVLAPNGSGAIINWLTRSGTEDPEGTVRITATDYENVRGDFYWGGPLAENWFAAISGYWQAGGTPRDTGFSAEKGGQFRIKLTRQLENGEMNLTYKKIEESNSFVLPLPVQNTLDGLVAIPGFDLSHGNTTSFDNSRTRILFVGGETLEANAQDGADASADSLTFNVKYDFDNGFSVNHSTRYSVLDRSFNGIWTGSYGANSIMAAENYLTNDDLNFANNFTVGEFFAANPGADRCFQYVSTGELMCAGDGSLDNLNGNGLAQVLNALNEPIRREMVISDTRFSYNTDNNSLSFGVIYANVRHKRALQTSFFLSDVTGEGARVLDIVAVDSDGDVQAYLSDSGVVKYGHWRGNDDVEVQSFSFYVNDEYQVTENLRIDAGLRYEVSDYRVSSLAGLGDRFVVAGALDSDGNDVDNILANNYANRLFGSGQTNRREIQFNEVAWTVGFNYTFNDDLAVYGRYASGYQTPRADRFGDLNNAFNAQSVGTSTVADLKFAELGVRYQGESLSASLTGFWTEFPNLPTGGFGFDESGTEILFEAEVSVIGVEFDLLWQPTEWLSLEALGVVQDAEFKNIDNPAVNWDGNTPARTPNAQVRISPTFHVNEDLDLYATYHWLSKRYGANDNIIEFPDCGIFDVGAYYAVNESVSFQVKGKNITSQVCWNEGNPRATSAENTLALGFARPIVGATWLASIQYDF